MWFNQRCIEDESGFSFRSSAQSGAAGGQTCGDPQARIASSLIALTASGALTLGLIVLCVSLMFERAIAAPLL